MNAPFLKGSRQAFLSFNVPLLVFYPWQDPGVLNWLREPEGRPLFLVESMLLGESGSPVASPHAQKTSADNGVSQTPPGARNFITVPQTLSTSSTSKGWVGL